MSKEKQFDVIVVGGSYAGLAAGMALGRALRNVLIIDAGDPCNKTTPHSHNFLTNDGRSPKEISTLAREQVGRYDTIRFLNTVVTEGQRTADGFKIATGDGRKFFTRKLIFATGIKDVVPEIPGLAACWGISALHCPYCHGYEVRRQRTGILAKGDTAFEMAALIANWTNDLTIYTNGSSDLNGEQLRKLKSKNIRVVETEIEMIGHQNGIINNIVFRNGERADLKALYLRPSFVQHSEVPASLGCEMTVEGYIKADAAQKTSVPGVYACGDNVTRMRTVANAVSMGTTAGMKVNIELIEEDF